MGIMNIEIIRGFLGWCSVINIGIMMLQTILIIVLRKALVKMHGKMFDLDEKFIMQACYQYLGQYKVAVLVLNIVPYFALKIIG